MSLAIEFKIHEVTIQTTQTNYLEAGESSLGQAHLPLMKSS